MPRADSIMPRVVIVGAGFGGLAAARALAGTRAQITLVDRTNHHLFQPLLYQVATAALSPSDVAAATRALIGGTKNIRVILGEVTAVDTETRVVRTLNGHDLPYDYLVLATGADYSFFGNEGWAEHASVLKTLADALSIRERLLTAFERAENSSPADDIRSLLTFVVVGGGPTGVEMAGAIAELARTAVSRDFRRITSDQIRIVLVEAGPRVLSQFPAGLPAYAEGALGKLGIELRLGESVRSIDARGLIIGDERIDTANVIWCAGTEARPAADWIGAEAARNRAVKVLPDCSVPNHPDIFAIGDVSNFEGRNSKPLPGLAAVAKQQGRYVGLLLRARIHGRQGRGEFHYRNWGTMAIVGRSAAVADFGFIRLKGSIAWLAWCLVHLMLLIDLRSRLTVYVNWAWAWCTRGRGVRLLTGAKHRQGASSTAPERPKPWRDPQLQAQS